MSADHEAEAGGLEKAAEFVERGAGFVPGAAARYVSAGASVLRGIAALVRARKKTLEQVLEEIKLNPPPAAISTEHIDNLIEENRRIEIQEKG